MTNETNTARASVNERLTRLRVGNTLKTEGHPVWVWTTFIDGEHGPVITVCGETEALSRDTAWEVVLAILDRKSK